MRVGPNKKWVKGVDGFGTSGWVGIRGEGMHGMCKNSLEFARELFIKSI